MLPRSLDFGVLIRPGHRYLLSLLEASNNTSEQQ